jgi:4-diphosphocytidyl-2-C-methyl-D-erythritol kinase
VQNKYQHIYYSTGKANFTANQGFMILFPNAKINIGLHVISKRPDYYHNLETLMHPIGLCDMLEILPSPETETVFKISGIQVPGKIEDNLVYKAYLLLKNKYNLPHLKIHLHKLIPLGAGLGGGSSDAAFMLNGLNDMFGLHLPVRELQNYAEFLGSDCSFFIENFPAFATGKGEILTPAENFITNYQVLLFFPGFPVSTSEAYKEIIPDPGKQNLKNILESGIKNWKEQLVNDFEKGVFTKYPQLGDLKEQLYDLGALYASMSGSGSAVYGIFERETNLPDSLLKNLIWISDLPKS